MAGRTVQEALLHTVAGGVLGADRVVGAHLRHLQRVGEVVLNVAGLLHEPAERALGVGSAGVEQHAMVAVFDIDALSMELAG